MKIQFLECLLRYLEKDIIYGPFTDGDAEVRDGRWNGEEYWQGFDGWAWFLAASNIKGLTLKLPNILTSLPHQ